MDRTEKAKTIRDMYLFALNKNSDHLSANTIAAIISHVLDEEKSFVFSHPEFSLRPEFENKIRGDIDDGAAGKPLAYIIGRKEFFNLSLRVNEAVLIPRPETEALVERIFDWANEKNKKSLDILELGTGSGAVTIALANGLPKSRFIASDISDKALDVARDNARLHNVSDRIKFLKSDMFGLITGRYDVIVANLPYIPRRELAFLPVARWEPIEALDGGDDGLWHIRRLIKHSPDFISTPGLIALEIESRQVEEVVSLAAATYPDSKIEAYRDFSGNDRIITIALNENDCPVQS